VGSKKGRRACYDYSTAGRRRVYGTAEHRLMGYDTQEALQFQGKIIKFVEQGEPRVKCDKNVIFSHKKNFK
jgi:hypothetical protein